MNDKEMSMNIVSVNKQQIDEFHRAREDFHKQLETWGIGKSKHTMIKYATTWRAWCDWCNANKLHYFDFSSINVKVFLSSLTCSREGKAKYLACIKVFIRLLYKALPFNLEVYKWFTLLKVDYTRNEMLGHQSHKPKPNQVRISRDELKQLLDLCNPAETMRQKRDLVILLLAYKCGTRTNETACLKWSDIDWKKELIFPNVAKNNTKDPLPLHNDLKIALLNWSDAVIDTLGYLPELIVLPIRRNDTIYNHKSPLDNTSMRYIVKKLGKQIGRPDIQFHTGRYFMADYYFHEKGLNEKQVQRLMRHSSYLTTMQIYISNGNALDEAKKVTDDWI